MKNYPTLMSMQIVIKTPLLFFILFQSKFNEETLQGMYNVHLRFFGTMGKKVLFLEISHFLRPFFKFLEFFSMKKSMKTIQSLS